MLGLASGQPVARSLFVDPLAVEHPNAAGMAVLFRKGHEPKFLTTSCSIKMFSLDIIPEVGVGRVFVSVDVDDNSIRPSFRSPADKSAMGARRREKIPRGAKLAGEGLRGRRGECSKNDGASVAGIWVRGCCRPRSVLLIPCASA